MEAELQKALFDILSSKKIKFNPKRIQAAIDFAAPLLLGRFRTSGDSFLAHSIKIAIECAKLEMDESTIVAALLHGVGYNSWISIKHVAEKFGEDVAFIVDGLTYVQKVAPTLDETRNTISKSTKLILSSSADIRTLIIKLLDKLEDLKMIDSLSVEEQERLIRRVQKIYSPLSEFIGLSKVKHEMDDLVLKYTNPKEYIEIQQALNAVYNTDVLEAAVEAIEATLDLNNIVHEPVSFRKKGICSLYNKLQTYQYHGKLLSPILNDVGNLALINDKFGIRILVNTVEDCYKTLSIVQTKYNLIDENFDDYIANPKPNGYRSLQVIAYIDPPRNDYIAEIQIRTVEMHCHNEFGPAAHIAYKVKSFGNEELDKDLYVFEELQRWKTSNSGVVQNPSGGISQSIYQIEVFRDNIFVFTRDADVIMLPKDATPIDFAFEIHSDLGMKCLGAHINGKWSKIIETLKTGDIVEIQVSKRNCAVKEWLPFVKSSKARKFLRKLE